MFEHEKKVEFNLPSLQKTDTVKTRQKLKTSQHRRKKMQGEKCIKTKNQNNISSKNKGRENNGKLDRLRREEEKNKIKIT